MVMTNIRRYIYQLINGRSSRGILAWCGMENTSGSARAIDQKGIHFPGKAEGEGELGDLLKWVLKCSPDWEKKIGARWALDEIFPCQGSLILIRV